MNDTSKSCILCGMPIESEADIPAGAELETAEWCKFCGNKDKLKSYEVALKDMTQFIIETNGISEAEARTEAKGYIENSLAFKSGRLVKAL